MRIALTLLLTLTCLTAFAQTFVTGTLVDSRTMKPVDYSHVIVMELNQFKIGCETDSTGRFRLPIGQNASLQFSSILYPRHEIHNLPTDTNIIDLGIVRIIDGGVSAYIMTGKKRGKRAKCIEFNNRKDLTDEDLTVKCPAGNGTFKWTFDRTAHLLSVDFEAIKNCTQQQP